MNREELEKYLYYDPDTGVIRNKSTGNAYKGINSSGYVVCYAGKKSMLVHRAAFILMGEELPHFVDHINRNKTDNRWENLRPCTRSENLRNRSRQSNSKTGVKNVYPHTDGGYYVQIRVEGKIHHLGTYATLDEASSVASVARLKLHGKFSHEGGAYQ